MFICTALVADEWAWSVNGLMLTGYNRRTQRNLSRYHLSTTDPTWSGLGLNLGQPLEPWHGRTVREHLVDIFEELAGAGSCVASVYQSYFFFVFLLSIWLPRFGDVRPSQRKGKLNSIKLEIYANAHCEVIRVCGSVYELNKGFSEVQPGSQSPTILTELFWLPVSLSSSLNPTGFQLSIMFVCTLVKTVRLRNGWTGFDSR
jgi:hypothetical protein